MIIVILYGVQLKILTDHYKLGLNFFQWFGLLRISTFTDLWLPSGGGTSVKALYLKKLHNLPYSSFIALTGIANIIKFMVNSLLAIPLLVVLGGRAALFLLPLFAAVLVGAFSLLFLSHRFRGHHFRSLDFMRNVLEEWHNVRKDRKMLKKLISVNCVIFVLTSAQIYVSFRAFSLNLSPMAGGVIAALIIISGVIRLIPGNFGVKEAIIIAVSGSAGIGVNGGLHAAALSRLVGLILTLLLAPLFAVGFHKKERSKHSYQEK